MEQRSPGDYTYIPLQRANYRYQRPSSVETANFVLLVYADAKEELPSDTDTPLGWLSHEMHCHAISGFYDHADFSHYLDDRGKHPLLVEFESISSALRRHGYSTAAEEMDRHFPEQAGRTEFTEFVEMQWPRVLLERKFPAARLLLEHGADVNAAVFEGLPPLHLMSLRFDEEGTRELLDMGADPEIRDPGSGLTALEVLEADSVSKRQVFPESQHPGNLPVAEGNPAARAAVIELLRNAPR
ncbi:hypothetical protein IT575_09790 [bacterium]|nr:hypothetical protein [bacterium]